MQDFKTIQDFRKGYRYSKVVDDPTYLTFFFMFDYYTEDSPLFNGEAVAYLRNVVGDPERADKLVNFIKILRRVNTELPWFWQSVTGLETTRQYGNLEEPWRGANNPSIEISCLETVELTTTGLIDLYKQAAYDFNRWVEIIPKNLRRFRMWIWVTEVRDFGSAGGRLNAAANKANGAIGALGAATGNTQLTQFSKTAGNLLDRGVKNNKPFFKIELGHCTWDIDSTSNVFSDLSRSPSEQAAPTIKIFYEKVNYETENNNSLLEGNRNLGEMLSDIAKEKVGAIADGALSRTKEAVIARALLGNVHGLNLMSTIQDAVSAGSVNSIANLVGSSRSTGSDREGGDLGTVNDRTPAKPQITINSNVYGQVAGDSEGLTSENVHQGSNVVDNEGPINQNVHK